MNADAPSPAEVEHRTACRIAYAAFDEARRKAWDDYYAVRDAAGFNSKKIRAAEVTRDFSHANARAVLDAAIEASMKKRDGR